MELSVVSPVQRVIADDERCTAAPELGLELIDVPVPPDLRRYGERVQASALGDPSKPPVLVLGGISANCFPASRPDGRRFCPPQTVSPVAVESARGTTWSRHAALGARIPW